MKLGGYEGCVHLGSVGSGGAALLSPGSVVSYGQDWRDLGKVAAGLLLQNDTESAVLLPAEQRLLDRLRVPPQFVHVDGEALATEIEALCSELELVGSSGRHELIVLPGRDLLRRDVPVLTQGLIPATDREALHSFVQDDLTGDKARLYCGAAAEALLENAVDIIAAVSDLPEAVGGSLTALANNSSIRLDVLGAALRLEQPFREIAETAEEASNNVRSGPVSMLTEQSRMHPTVCELVSETFYGGRLTTAERIVNRACPIIPSTGALAAPLVLFDLPSLSRSRIEALETFEGTSPANRAETTAVFEALDILGPASGEMPTLAILSPYTPQCNLLRSLVATHTDQHTGLLGGFTSPKGDGLFVHTIDSFQGGEADVVIVSTVRNNQKVGRHALGILGDRRRMNVLLSRARHKLVLVTSTGFLRNAIQWSENEQESGSDLGFLGGCCGELTGWQSPMYVPAAVCK